ncbi:hypothetical protein BKA80DRAFT_277217 [Phyllosticta citrichinensis]
MLGDRYRGEIWAFMVGQRVLICRRIWLKLMAVYPTPRRASTWLDFLWQALSTGAFSIQIVLFH